MVSEWPVPISVKEVRSFLGLAGYYRRFVKNYAYIASPLNPLMKKDQPFTWSDETQETFEALKRALTSPPVLAMPNDTGKFVLTQTLVIRPLEPFSHRSKMVTRRSSHMRVDLSTNEK